MGSGPVGVTTPEEKLSMLMKRDLGVDISARELRMFIRANWRKVSAYSHAIHCSDGQKQVQDVVEE